MAHDRPQQRRSRTTHVPALDGVRAVAVAAVLAFHGGLPGASGGFLGVDAFFVLSGYLITALLLAEWTRNGGRLDLAAFWGRRARRLLPALLLVVTAVAIGARAWLPPEEVRLLRGDGIAALFYVANWRMILRGGDYFAQTAAPSPLEHTWSLGIEEQFYLVWPLVLWAVLRIRRPGASPQPRLWMLVAVCLVGAAASTAALAATYVVDDPGRAYYGTDTRGAAILVGAGLAALLAVRDRRGRAASGVTAPPPTATRWESTTLGGLAAIAGIGLAWAATHVSGGDRGLYGGGMAAVALAVAVVVAHVVLVPIGVVGARPVDATAPRPRADLVRRLPLALAGLHRRQRLPDRSRGPAPLRCALPGDPGPRHALVRARRAARPAPRAPAAPGPRHHRSRRRRRGRRRRDRVDDGRAARPRSRPRHLGVRRGRPLRGRGWTGGQPRRRRPGA